jgi:hypothetical protein
MADLAERIDALESRLAVADLIHIYAKYIRADEPEKVAGLFLPDGTFEVRNGHPDKAEYTVQMHHPDRQAIDASMSAMKGKPHPVPLIRNLVVEVDGDTATANSVMDAQIYGTTHKIMGEYRDSCRRVDGRWYFASRSFTMYGDALAI